MDFDLDRIAQLARIELDEEEKERFASQLSDVLDYVAKLGELDLEGIEPTAHAVPVSDVLREDVARREDCLSQDAVLSNTPDRSQGQFRVPKVVE